MTKSAEIIQNLHNYDDYRLFLRDWFTAKKSERSGFSLRAFAARAGFSGHNFFSYLVAGTRNCSAESARKIAHGMGLKNKASDYFEHLVMMNQAQTGEEREIHFQRLKRLMRQAKKHLNPNQYAFYEHWYYPVVRELMAMNTWQNDPARLARMVFPPISTADAKTAISFLLSSGMIVISENNLYELAHIIVSSEQVPAYIKKKSRRDVLLKGAEIIDTVHPERKYCSYTTVAVSRNCFSEVRQILDDARESVLARIAEDHQPEEVYEVVFQMFPVSAAAGTVNSPTGIEK